MADLGSSGTENWQWVDAKGQYRSLSSLPCQLPCVLARVGLA